MERPMQELHSAQFDINSAADKATFSFAFPARIERIALICQSADTGGATVKFDKRPLAGSDSGRGDGDIGVLTVPASSLAGKVLYKKLSGIDVTAGDEVVVEVTAESAAANSFAVAVIEYQRITENPVNLDDAVASA